MNIKVGGEVYTVREGLNNYILVRRHAPNAFEYAFRTAHSAVVHMLIDSDLRSVDLNKKKKDSIPA